MNEQFVPGEYTVTNVDGLNIRAAMNTYQNANIVGKFSNGENFKVYQVYPEVDGIVWGRVSSSTETGVARYVGLRVNNHPKVKLERVFESQPTSQDYDLIAWVVAADMWLRSQGFDGPRPFSS